MKKRFAFFTITFIAIFSSCKKDDIISTPDQVGISKVTYYATITLTGDAVVSIVQGTAFVDPGVAAEAGGAEIPVTTTGNVDKDQVGLYTVNYSATNKDGFSSSASRIVVVIPEPESPGVDLSGTYSAVSASAGEATVTKVAPGVYYTTNCWNGATEISAYFICTDGATIIVPNQSSPYGSFESTGPGTYDAGLITWELILLDQGPLVRTRKWQKL